VSDYVYQRVPTDDTGPGYNVMHQEAPDKVLGTVWRETPTVDRWSAVVGATGEVENGFTTRERAADWLRGKTAVLPGGKAAAMIPDDPYQGLPGQ
jgi:hypothetical protein